MKLNKMLGTLIAVSMLSISPAWAAEPKPDTPSKPVIKYPDATKLPKVVLESIDRIAKKFGIKEYDHIKVEDMYQNTVALNIDANDQTVSGAQLELDMVTGEVKHISLLGKRDFSNEISMEEAKEKASEFLKLLLEEEADDYQLLSVWNEDKIELGQKKKRVYSQFNYKAPASGNSEKADYVEIRITSGGTFMNYDKKTLPVSYDSWYGADKEKRVNPNDELPDSAGETLERLREMFPTLKNYPVERIVAGKDGTAKVYLQKDKGNVYPGANLKVDEKGQLLYFYIVEPSLNKPATETAAKEIASAFLKSYLGDEADTYTLSGVQPKTHSFRLPSGPLDVTLTRVSFKNSKTSKQFHIEVASTGDVCRISQE
jgi:hypothetical protein